MNCTCGRVALVLLLSSVGAHESTVAADLILAQAIQTQDACQSPGNDGEYALELLQKQVSRRATKPFANSVVPPVVDPGLAETIADLTVEARTGTQRIEGLRMMMDDVQGGLDKAIDLAEKTSVSRHEGFTDLHGGRLSISSASNADFASANAAVEAQLAELAGSTQLRANRVAQKALDIQREFQAVREDLNHIKRDDVHVVELVDEGSSMFSLDASANADTKKIRAAAQHALSEATDAAATHAMMSAVMRGDHMRAAEDLQREQVPTSESLDEVTTKAAKTYDDAVVRPSSAEVDAAFGMPGGGHRLFGAHSDASELTAVQRRPAVFSDRFAKQEQRAGVAADKVREAVAQTQHEERRVASASAAVKAAQENVNEMLSRHTNRAIGIAQAVEDATQAMKARRLMKTGSPAVAALGAKQEAAEDATQAAIKARHVMKTANPGSQAVAALAAKQEAVYANQERALAESEKESVAGQYKNIAALQKQRSSPYQAVQVDDKESHVFASPEAVEVAAKVVSAPWVEAAHRAHEISTAEHLDVEGNVVAMQRHPAVASDILGTFSEQQDRAESAAQEVIQAKAQTKHEEQQVATAAAGVEEARKRVKRRLVDHEELYPPPVQEKAEKPIKLTPEEVAEQWMDSVIHDGEAGQQQTS